MRGIVWSATLILLMACFAAAIVGWRFARRRDTVRHRRWMIGVAVSLSIWLAAYVTKQVVVGFEPFMGAPELKRNLYLPVLIVHMACAISFLVAFGRAAGLGWLKPRRVEDGSGWAFDPDSAARHRKSGRIALMLFALTLATALPVYYMLLFLG